MSRSHSKFNFPVNPSSSHRNVASGSKNLGRDTRRNLSTIRKVSQSRTEKSKNNVKEKSILQFRDFYDNKPIVNLDKYKIPKNTSAKAVATKVSKETIDNDPKNIQTSSKQIMEEKSESKLIVYGNTSNSYSKQFSEIIKLDEDRSKMKKMAEFCKFLENFFTRERDNINYIKEEAENFNQWTRNSSNQSLNIEKFDDILINLNNNRDFYSPSFKSFVGRLTNQQFDDYSKMLNVSISRNLIKPESGCSLLAYDNLTNEKTMHDVKKCLMKHQKSPKSRTLVERLQVLKELDNVYNYDLSDLLSSPLLDSINKTSLNYTDNLIDFNNLLPKLFEKLKLNNDSCLMSQDLSFKKRKLDHPVKETTLKSRNDPKSSYGEMYSSIKTRYRKKKSYNIEPDDDDDDDTNDDDIVDAGSGGDSDSDDKDDVHTRNSSSESVLKEFLNVLNSDLNERNFLINGLTKPLSKIQKNLNIVNNNDNMSKEKDSSASRKKSSFIPQSLPDYDFTEAIFDEMKEWENINAPKTFFPQSTESNDKNDPPITKESFFNYYETYNNSIMDNYCDFYDEICDDFPPLSKRKAEEKSSQSINEKKCIHSDKMLNKLNSLCQSFSESNINDIQFVQRLLNLEKEAMETENSLIAKDLTFTEYFHEYLKNDRKMTMEMKEKFIKIFDEYSELIQNYSDKQLLLNAFCPTSQINGSNISKHEMKDLVLNSEPIESIHKKMFESLIKNFKIDSKFYNKTIDLSNKLNWLKLEKNINRNEFGPNWAEYLATTQKLPNFEFPKSSK